MILVSPSSTGRLSEWLQRHDSELTLCSVMNLDNFGCLMLTKIWSLEHCPITLKRKFCVTCGLLKVRRLKLLCTYRTSCLNTFWIFLLINSTWFETCFQYYTIVVPWGDGVNQILPLLGQKQATSVKQQWDILLRLDKTHSFFHLANISHVTSICWTCTQYWG